MNISTVTFYYNYLHLSSPSFLKILACKCLLSTIFTNLSFQMFGPSMLFVKKAQLAIHHKLSNPFKLNTRFNR